jgi:hypothetical protein
MRPPLRSGELRLAPERPPPRSVGVALWQASLDTRISHNSRVSEHGERNREGLEKLRRLTSLSEAELAKDVGDGWKVSTVVGHMAFFDRLLLLRWDTYEKDGVFAELTPNHFDLINYAGAGDWSALPPQETVGRCIESAERAVARINALPERVVTAVLDTPRVALLDRMIHWNPHLQQIETAIGREI